MTLHGHGLRERQIRGVRAPWEPPALVTIQTRRYACQRCGAILVVVPTAVGARRLFDLATIAFALARWVVDRVASRVVRTELSPLPFVGDSAGRGWSQLRRWGRQAVAILRPPRPVAFDGSRAAMHTVLETVAATAPPSGAGRPLAERAFAAMASPR